MKRILPIILLIIIMTNTPTYGQVESMPVNEECFEINRRDNEYFIQINGINYQDGDDIYLCDNNDDVVVQLIYNLPDNPLDMQPVMGDNWNWSRCNCTIPNPEGSSFLVTSQDFGNLKKCRSGLPLMISVEMKIMSY